MTDSHTEQETRKKCVDCRHFDLATRTAGICRLAPPAAMRERFEQPNVSLHDWCSQWRSKDHYVERRIDMALRTATYEVPKGAGGWPSGAGLWTFGWACGMACEFAMRGLYLWWRG